MNPNPNPNTKPQPNPNLNPTTKPQPSPNPNFTNWEVAKEVYVLLNAKTIFFVLKKILVPWHLIRFIFMNIIIYYLHYSANVIASFRRYFLVQVLVFFEFLYRHSYRDSR